jgi:L-lactate dehydrogenase complex protein LldG
MNQNQLLIIQAKFGVAENGAVWIETNFPRELITLSQYIAIKLSKDNIVSNMHQAYDMIDSSNLAFGMFLSGPSKTADIEQALVIGAHGALGLKCFIS